MAATISKCASCGYPLKAEYSGQRVSCPMCGTPNEAILGKIGVGVGSTFFWCLFSFVGGVMLGPAVKRQIEKIS